ncbi:MAG: VWA domain-containing protein [Chitinophagaceae bacterium]|nr:VWA domain-containing protein [Chitinophagaceae bacterium]
MPRPLRRTAAVCSLLLSFVILQSPVDTDQSKNKSNNNPKIQIAILLDVSSSMNGLIDQAKNQLWNMVNILSKVRCSGVVPKIEIALYEYGRSANDPAGGYIKQISVFTNDLDKLFSELIILKTNGGDEYCGHVMYNSLTQLDWDTVGNSYKVIFIAGNESFLQGNISFTEACEKAKQKGVVVNTIYCGERSKGIAEHWDLGAECGNGSFSNIDHNAKPLSIKSPYDDSIIRLKDSLNETLIVYGIEGRHYYNSMMQSDTMAVYNLNDPTKITQYVIVKANSNLVSNPKWDLVDAIEKNPMIIDTLDMNTLDDSLKNKSRKELKQIVKQRGFERNHIRARIVELSIKQEKYIKAEKERLKEPRTLESEIEKIIREQVGRVKMKIE